MNATSFRLSPPNDNLFVGHQIDRSKPLKFKLNGREVSGFAGDSVLSALLASGIYCAGKHSGSPLALDENLKLAVKLAGSGQSALPIERTPAIDGVELETFGTPSSSGAFGWLMRLGRHDGPSLGLDLNATLSVPGPLGEAEVTELTGIDIVVIGGGIAGLSAAVRAEEAGKTVLLVERRPYLGGDAVLFGNAAGEEAPERAIARLTETLSAKPGVTVLTSADALSLMQGKVLVHQVRTQDGLPSPRLLEVSAENIVIATGTQDRLPFFQGNRLPGVISLSDAFQRASAYGIWAEAPSAVVTNTNAVYRLALLAHEAGVEIDKIMDSRLAPQSRFAEFAKAYGIKSESGLKPQSVGMNANGSGLVLNMELSWEGGSGAFAPLSVGSVIACGGWLPRLALWHQAGGKVVLDDFGIMQASGTLPGVTLAGTCANFVSNSAIIQSGINAVDILLGHTSKIIAENQIDPAFESPDGDFPVSPLREEEDVAPAYFDNGSSLVTSPRQQRHGIFHLSSGVSELAAIADRALTLGDVCTQYALGKLPAHAFQAIARERSVVPVWFSAPDTTSLPESDTDSSREPYVPSYLNGRFGSDAELREIRSEDGRRFETGNLLYANSDTDDPMEALGVIVSVEKSNKRSAIALLRSDTAEAGHQISVMSSRGHTAAKVASEAE